MEESLGKRIKQLRLAKDLTMADLAKKAGVTRSLISLIEKGNSIPSIQTLYKLAEVLEIPIKKFFEPEIDFEPEDMIIIRSGKRNILTTPDNKLKMHILSPNKNVKIEFSIWEIQPHKKNDPCYLYKHEGEEHFYVLSGELKLKVGDNIFLIKQDDSGCFDSGEFHNYFNMTNSPVKVLLATSYNCYSYSELFDDDFLYQ